MEDAELQELLTRVRKEGHDLGYTEGVESQRLVIIEREAQISVARSSGESARLQLMALEDEAAALRQENTRLRARMAELIATRDEPVVEG